MKRGFRLFFAFLLIAALFVAQAGSVSASKRVYKATLTTGAELHEVVGSSARGSFLMGFNMDGSMQFMLSVRGLSGPVGGAHIHAPASATENAPVVLTLCGGPSPAVVATCTVTDGVLTVEGTFTSAFLQGISGAAFLDALEAGLTYVNVHTGLNPAGEARGQIIPQ